MAVESDDEVVVAGPLPPVAEWPPLGNLGDRDWATTELEAPAPHADEDRTPEGVERVDLTVRTLAADGRPLAGVLVAVSIGGAGRRTFLEHAVSDDAGRAWFPAVPVTQRAEVGYRRTGRPEAKRWLPLSAGAPVSMDLAEPAGAKVRIRVEDAHARLAPFAWLPGAPASLVDGVLVIDEWTDERGEAVWTGLPEGQRWVSAARWSWSTRKAASELTLVDDMTEDVRLRLPFLEASPGR
jgi:hypothetical protein